MRQNKDIIVYDIDCDIQKKNHSLEAPIAERNGSSNGNITYPNDNVNLLPLNNMPQYQVLNTEDLRHIHGGLCYFLSFSY